MTRLKGSPLWLIFGAAAASITALIALTAVLTPERSSAAYAAAIQFTNAAAAGDEVAAFALLNTDLQAYVVANCPEASVAACVDAYTPLEWGRFISAVFRRSIPDERAWDVLLVATYEAGQGFSGVCIYNRVEQMVDGQWRVTAWSGFIACDEPQADLSRLRRADAPNRAPP